MFKNLSFIAFIAIIATSCTVDVNKGTTYTNTEIPADITTEIAKLDNEIYRAMINGKPDNISHLLSAALHANEGKNLDSIFNILSGLFANSQLIKVSDYYTVNRARNVPCTIQSQVDTDNEFQLNYSVLDSKSFLSLNRVRVGATDYVLAFIYGKTPQGWKLYYFKLGSYALYGKTAIDYYKQVKHYNNLGCLVDAANASAFARKTIRPIDQFWKYKKEEEISIYCSNLLNRVNVAYQFPILIEQVSTKPQIVSISPRMYNERYIVQINYYSDISIVDTVSLQAENMELRKVIGEVFKGIDVDKDVLMYAVSNEMPSDKMKEVNAYIFLQEFNKE